MSRFGKIKNDILEGTLSLTIATITVKILGAIYKIPLAHILGEEGMGYFNCAYTIYSFFYLLCTAGVPKAIMILIGNAKKELNEEKAKSVVKIGTAFFGFVGAIITALFISLSKPLSSLIGSYNSYVSMLAIAPSILFVAVSGVLRGYLSADSKFLHVSISQIIEGVGRLVFGLLFAHMAEKLYMAINVISAFTIFGSTCGSLLGLFYLAIVSKSVKSNNISRQKNVKNSKNIIIEILKISLPITASAAVMSITNMIDLSLVIKRLISLGYASEEATALYGNYTTYATPIFNLVLSLFTQVTIVFLPMLIKENKNKAMFSKILEEEFSLSFIFLIPITLGTCLYSYEIIKVLFDAESIEIGAKLLSYLSLSLFFAVPLIIINSALESLGKIYAPMISMLFGSFVKLFISYILISNSNFGIFGAPIGTLCSYLFALIVSMVIAGQELVENISVYKILFLPSINSFISVVSTYFVYKKISVQYNFWHFLLSVIVTIITYFILFFLTYPKDEVKLASIRKNNIQKSGNKYG